MSILHCWHKTQRQDLFTFGGVIHSRICQCQDKNKMPVSCDKICKLYLCDILARAISLSGRLISRSLQVYIGLIPSLWQQWPCPTISWCLVPCLIAASPIKSTHHYTCENWNWIHTYYLVLEKSLLFIRKMVLLQLARGSNANSRKTK